MTDKTRGFLFTGFVFVLYSTVGLLTQNLGFVFLGFLVLFFTVISIVVGRLFSGVNSDKPLVEIWSRFTLVSISIFTLVLVGVPPVGLLLVGLIGGFLSVPSGGSNKFLTPLLTIGVTNGILWMWLQNLRSQMGSSIDRIVRLGDNPPSNWFENWQLFVVMMVVGSFIGVVYQNQRETPQTVSSPTDSLQSLTDMRDKGLITEEEFESKKKELLDRL